MFRRVASLEEDLDVTEQKMVIAVGKLDKAGTAADDSERAKKVFQSKAEDDDRRINQLEKDLKDAREKAENADTTYDEVAKKLAGDGEDDDDGDGDDDVIVSVCESDLEKAEDRADVGEIKIMELEEELRVVANNLKSLEVAAIVIGNPITIIAIVTTVLIIIIITTIIIMIFIIFIFIMIIIINHHHQSSSSSSSSFS